MKTAKLFKRFMCLALAAVMVMSLAACGNSGAADGKIKVGVIQLIENGAFNDMRDGFVEQLRAKGYTEDKIGRAHV